MKVVDWIQRSNSEAWDKTRDSRDPRKLLYDPKTHLPAHSYQKQEPIYATAYPHSGNLEPELGGGHLVRERSSGSMPGQQRHPRQERGIGIGNPRHGMESRQRIATVSGYRFPGASREKLHPMIGRHGAAPAPQGRGGREVQRPAVQSNVTPPNYPTAKFGKDYYVLDV